jgi:hypothetical protein
MEVSAQETISMVAQLKPPRTKLRPTTIGNWTRASHAFIYSLQRYPAERGGSRDPAPPSLAAAGEEGVGTLGMQATPASTRSSAS